MIKHLHMAFVLLTFISFTSRIILSQINPAFLKQKWVKISPHIIDTILLASGITLVFQGNWLATDYAWIIAKIVLLVMYIGLGVVAMRSRGTLRWLAFCAAIGCYSYIAMIAITKHILLN